MPIKSKQKNSFRILDTILLTIIRISLIIRFFDASADHLISKKLAFFYFLEPPFEFGSKDEN